MKRLVIGVLGLQGDFHAHARMLGRLGIDAPVVKKREQLGNIDGLVIPGGESTTLIKLMDAYGLWEPLKRFAFLGRGILGTCAGMILLAKEVRNPAQKSLGLIDVVVERNSYGRQRESFESTGTFKTGGQERQVPMVFIRAPRILYWGSEVEPIAFWNDECVAVRHGNVIVASFHPELTDDLTLHSFFVEMVRDTGGKQPAAATLACGPGPSPDE